MARVIRSPYRVSVPETIALLIGSGLLFQALSHFLPGTVTHITNPFCKDVTEVFLEAVVVLSLFFGSTLLLKRLGHRSKKKAKSAISETLPSTAMPDDCDKSDEGCIADQSPKRATVEEFLKNCSDRTNDAPSAAILRRPVVRHATGPGATSGMSVPTTISPPVSRPASPVSSADSDSDWRRGADWRKASAPPPEVPVPDKCRFLQFIEINGLDARCANMLQRLQPAQAEWVMDQEFIVGVDQTKGSASSKVVYKISKSMTISGDFWTSYPSTRDLKKRLATFAEINSLDKRCLMTLQQLPEERLKRVMDEEFVVQVDPSKGTASAKVVGRILRTNSSPM